MSHSPWAGSTRWTDASTQKWQVSTSNRTYSSRKEISTKIARNIFIKQPFCWTQTAGLFTFHGPWIFARTHDWTANIYFKSKEFHFKGRGQNYFWCCRDSLLGKKLACSAEVISTFFPRAIGKVNLLILRLYLLRPTDFTRQCNVDVKSTAQTKRFRRCFKLWSAFLSLLCRFNCTPSSLASNLRGKFPLKGRLRAMV